MTIRLTSTATNTPALALRAAALSCLAWAVLLLRGVAADELADPENVRFPPVDAAASDPAVNLALQTAPATGDGPALDGQASAAESGPTEDNAIESVTTPKATQWADLNSAWLESHPAWRSAFRYVPLGMVPYIGPRTPDDKKDYGIGGPLPGKGWRSQPFYIAGFVGATDGGPLVPGHVNQRPSVYSGINIGWNYDHYWGIEKRLGFGALDLTNGSHQPIPQTGLSVTGEYRLMYYPLGDTRWRPFLTAGVGWSDFYFNDDRGASHLDTVGMIPFGVGLKYLINDRWAARIDLIDEMTFGDGAVSNFHYAALTAGVELRYGHRLLNMPWHRKTADGN